MATMKDVAARAKVSVSTVSIILNGKSQQRKIPQATQQLSLIHIYLKTHQIPYEEVEAHV